MKTNAMRQINYKKIIITILLLQMVSCKLTSRVSSVLQDQSCSPPCWQGIVPGKTTREEATGLLNKIPWINQDSIKNYSDSYQTDTIVWSGRKNSRNIVGDAYGRIFFTGDIVELIKITPYPGSIKFSDLINMLGEPETTMRFVLNTERIIIYIDILYPSKGFAFSDYYYFNPDRPRNVEVTPDEEVKSVWYGNPEHFLVFFQNGWINRLSAEELDHAMQEWAGYRGYSNTRWP